MKNKKGLEMSFSWIFAIIAGIAILFIAIYATSHFIKTRRTEIDIQTAAKLAILIDPLETGLESGKSSLLSFDSETRIYNKCESYGNFGEQKIGIAKSSRIGEKWQEPAYGKPQYNKYIFSQDIEEAKEFYIISKPLNLPFKISDIIIFSGRGYCFIESPEDIKDELEDLGIKNINFTDKKSECSDKSTKVCFGQSAGCDIAVYGDSYDFSSGYVKTQGKELEYVDDLLYAAIFSSPDIYECNIKRLMLRLVNLCLIYKDKIKILERKECNSLLDSHLSEMMSLANTNNVLTIKEKADEIAQINEAAECRVY